MKYFPLDFQLLWIALTVSTSFAQPSNFLWSRNGHQGPVDHVFSLLDRNQFLTASKADQSIFLWDNASGNYLESIVVEVSWMEYTQWGYRSYTSKWYDLALGNGRKHLAKLEELTYYELEISTPRTGISGYIIQINDFVDHNVLDTLWLDYRPISAALLEQNDLLIFSRDRYLYYYDYKQKVYLDTIDAGARITHISQSSDGSSFCATLGDTVLTIWKIFSPTPLHTIKIGKKVADLQYSQSNDLIAAGCSDGTVLVFDSAGIQIHTLIGHQDTITHVEFSKNDNYLFSSSYDKTVKEWRLSDGVLQQTILDPSEKILSFSLVADNEFITGGDKSLIKRRYTEAISTIDTIAVVGLDTWYANFFNSDKLILVPHYNLHWVYDAVSGKALYSYPFDPGGERYMHPNGIHFTTFSQTGDISLYEAATGKKTKNLISLSLSLQWGALGFSPDGSLLGINPRADSLCYVVNVPTSTLIKTFPQQKYSNQNSVAISNDNSLLAFDDSETIGIWDIASGNKLATFTQPDLSSHIVSLHFLSDGKRLLIFNNGIYVYDLYSQSIETIAIPAHPLLRSQTSFLSYSYESDSDELLFYTSKGLVVWDIQSKTIKNTLTFVDTLSWAEFVDISSDKKRILAVKWHSALFVYDTAIFSTVESTSISNHQEVTVTPNPFSSVLDFHYYSENTANVTLSIFNVLGQKVFETSQIATSGGEQTLSLNLGSILPGTYFYTLKIGDSLTSGKILKAK